MRGLSIIEQWRDFIGLWITSEREARRAAVSWIRTSSGGGTREEELALGAAGRRIAALEVVGRLTALEFVGRRFMALKRFVVLEILEFVGRRFMALKRLVVLEFVGRRVMALESLEALGGTLKALEFMGRRVVLGVGRLMEIAGRRLVSLEFI